MITQSDIKNAVVAKRYTKALLELAQEKNIVPAILNDLQVVCDTINSSDELEQILIHPAVDIKEKKSVINDLFAQKIDDNLLKFLNLLLEQNRIEILTSILNFYIEMKDSEEGILKVTVKSAVEIPDDLKEKLVNKLQAKFNKVVVPEYEVDTKIIAGLIIKSEDNIIDDSYATKFDNMKQQLR